jgi:hypothetical protein
MLFSTSSECGQGGSLLTVSLVGMLAALYGGSVFTPRPSAHAAETAPDALFALRDIFHL